MKKEKNSFFEVMKSSPFNPVINTLASLLVFYGVVPNYIDLTFIWLAFLIFFSGLLIFYELSNRHLHMTYHVLITDLMGLVRTNLYKHVNSYYIPNMFAILSLYFVNPLLYRMVQN